MPNAIKPAAASWSLRDLKDLKSNVLARIASSKDIPEHWKQALSAEVEVHPAKALRLDAHWHSSPDTGKCVFHLDISPLF